MRKVYFNKGNFIALVYSPLEDVEIKVGVKDDPVPDISSFDIDEETANVIKKEKENFTIDKLTKKDK